MCLLRQNSLWLFGCCLKRSWSQHQSKRKKSIPAAWTRLSCRLSSLSCTSNKPVSTSCQNITKNKYRVFPLELLSDFRTYVKIHDLDAYIYAVCRLCIASTSLSIKGPVSFYFKVFRVKKRSIFMLIYYFWHTKELYIYFFLMKLVIFANLFPTQK